MTEDEQKTLLLAALTGPVFKWRSIEALSRIAQADLLSTRQLLGEIGARRSTGQREVWTLETQGETLEITEEPEIGGES